MSLGLDLVTQETFNVTMDIEKGSNVNVQPEWSHGIGMGSFSKHPLFRLTCLECQLSRFRVEMSFRMH